MEEKIEEQRDETVRLRIDRFMRETWWRTTFTTATEDNNENTCNV
jgi:hypothetical protein